MSPEEMCLGMFARVDNFYTQGKNFGQLGVVCLQPFGLVGGCTGCFGAYPHLRLLVFPSDQRRSLGRQSWRTDGHREGNPPITQSNERMNLGNRKVFYRLLLSAKHGLDGHPQISTDISTLIHNSNPGMLDVDLFFSVHGEQHL